MSNVTILATIANAITKAPAGLQSVGSRGWYSLIREPFTGAWQKNIEVRTDTVLTYGAVYACIRQISSDIAKLRAKLVEETEGIWSEISSPAFSPVIRKPNHYQTRIQFMQQWIISKLIHGNAYILKERDERKVVVALYVLDPTRVKVLVAPDGEVYYELRRDDLSGLPENTTTIPASEIIHDVMNPLFHPLVGISPIYASGLAAMQGVRIQTNSANFFGNFSNPGGVLSAPGEINASTAARIKEAWEANFTGGNFGRIAVLGDDLKFTPMAVTAVDAQLIEQLKWTAENVCTAFGVPAYKVGIGAPPTYNNIQALNTEYYSQCLQILIESVELCLDEGLGLTAVAGRTLGVELDLDGLLRMDSVTQMDVLDKAVKAAVYSPNEARAKVDKKPVKGGESPMIQQQNFSLAALAKRDAKDDPFAGSGSAPKPKPAQGDGDDSDDEQKSINWDVVRLTGIGAGISPLALTHQPQAGDR